MLTIFLFDWLDIDPNERPEFWEYVEAHGYKKDNFDALDINTTNELIEFYSMQRSTKESFILHIAYLVMEKEKNHG
jgi:hypothetical protein